MIIEPRDYRLNQISNGAIDRLGNALSALVDLLAEADMSEQALQKIGDSAKVLMDAMHEALVEAFAPAVDCMRLLWDELWSESELSDDQPRWRTRRYDATRTHMPRAQVMAHNTRHYHRRGFPN